jgi:hypothetical protein
MGLDGFDQMKRKLGSQTAATLFPSWLSNLTRSWFLKKSIYCRLVANRRPDCLAYHFLGIKDYFSCFLLYFRWCHCGDHINQITSYKVSFYVLLSVSWILAYNACTCSLNCAGSLRLTTNLILSPYPIAFTISRIAFRQPIQVENWGSHKPTPILISWFMFFDIYFWKKIR